jgi:hypothetical protein
MKYTQSLIALSFIASSLLAGPVFADQSERNAKGATGSLAAEQKQSTDVAAGDKQSLRKTRARPSRPATQAPQAEVAGSQEERSPRRKRVRVSTDAEPAQHKNRVNGRGRQSHRRNGPEHAELTGNQRGG